MVFLLGFWGVSWWVLGAGLLVGFGVRFGGVLLGFGVFVGAVVGFWWVLGGFFVVSAGFWVVLGVVGLVSEKDLHWSEVTISAVFGLKAGFL